ncbi:hypothetical protein MTR67_043157 [Solanum verrucosum]|uniref:Uncharacterized protein n=1 Tax=Solanum verrucosum TaxID=315347 RepID=A0AAF0ZRU2_SOLVR|nr:hypothetical protein MTR67_043157 [Solanum verrucosum]
MSFTKITRTTPKSS